mgnify:CR=1 FL=1
MTEPNSGQKTKDEKSPRKVLFEFAKSFLVPTLVGKSFVLYFGINYSQYPGEGYGFGLIAAIAVTVISLLAFAWKYKDQEEL